MTPGGQFLAYVLKFDLLENVALFYDVIFINNFRTLHLLALEPFKHSTSEVFYFGIIDGRKLTNDV
jgi:hypothetical protein